MKQKNQWIFIITLFLSTVTQAQLTKKTWLVGGTGKFSSYNQSYTSSNFSVEEKYNQIDISLSIGYFVVGKLAFGLKPTFSSINGKPISPGAGSTNVQRYWIGPFGRYYFLNTEKQYNIVTDVSYQFGFLGGGLVKGSLATFSALAGPVIYFNSSVGIEFLLGYNYTKEDGQKAIKDIKKGFQTLVGLQIHLEK